MIELEVVELFKFNKLLSVFAGVELKRKKLRLTGSALLGDKGDLGVDWMDVGTGDLFKRRYERFDDDSDDADNDD
jgi:hypothetical protein